MNVRNLAAAKEVRIIGFVPNGNSNASVEKGTKDMMTDGVFGDPNDCYGGAWAHFYRGMGRRLVIDLGSEYAVTGFDAGFIQGHGLGIYSPEKVRLLLSEDGERFYAVSEVKAPYPATFETVVRASYEASLGTPLKARYAAIDFTVEVNVFCDEIRVFGCDCDGSEKLLTGKPDNEPYAGHYESRDSLGGSHDIPLLYYGYWPENERIAKSTKEDFIPYIAYIDRDGRMTDTMFDSIMFLIVQGRCPSGGNLGYAGPPSLLSDWEYILDGLFADGVGLKALDAAVAEMKETLSLPDDHILPVYLTAPTPKISQSPFGDMNGDGIDEKLLTLDDRVNAYAWYIDRVNRRFSVSNLPNLRIDGYFWGNESISRERSEDEEEFARRCVSELHKRGLKFVFIPYYQAGGSEKAKSCGFDCVTMQPNLSFNKPLQIDPKGMMEDFSALCMKYGFGVEMEIHHGVRNPSEMKRYGGYFLQYLRSCVGNGMMTDTVHTYYQCAGPGVFYDLAKSDNEYLRGIYDKLYKFIKGTLTEEDFDELPEEKEISPAAEEIKPEEPSFKPAEEEKPEPEAAIPFPIPEGIPARGRLPDEHAPEAPAAKKKISTGEKKALLCTGAALLAAAGLYLIFRRKNRE